jgi:hypothetical protein
MADRLALIIANSDFEDEKLCRLKTPTRDAKALAAVLGDPDIGDFDVTLLIDEPEPVVRRRIARLYTRRKRSDLLLLYYSGHGIRDAHGDLYLATRDTEMDIAGATALSASFVREQLDKSNSQRKVVMLDCCHSGAFAKAGLGDSVGTEDAFTGSGYGRVILTASDALELSWEGDEWLGEGRPSVFTNFLVEGLRTGAADLDGDGKIVLDELYKYVYERVMTSGYAKQTPHKWAQQVEGQIVVARSPRPPSRTTGLPLYEAAQRSADDRGMGVPAREPERPTWQEKVVSSFGQTLQSLISSTPAWAWTTGGTVLVLLIVALFSQGFGLWAEPGPTMTPSETLPAASTATATVEPTLTSTSSTPRPAVTSTPTWLPDVPPPNASLGDTWTRPTDEAVMVYVPAGEFEMGSTEGDSDEQPVHDVTLDGFWIDKHEVTNAQFAAFLNEKGNQEEGGTTWLELDSDDCLIEKSGEEFRPKSGYADHPVVEVSWYGAKAYAKWVGGQLPSEAEWEYAARGPMFIPGATNLMGQG